MKSLSFVGCLMAALMVLLFAVGLITSALPARAQSGLQCGRWDAVAAELLSRHAEQVLFEGTPGPGGHRIVITAKPDGTTWTALSVNAEGLACVRGLGDAWTAGGRPAATGQEG
jgi:hypothetical protein